MTVYTMYTWQYFLRMHAEFKVGYFSEASLVSIPVRELRGSLIQLMEYTCPVMGAVGDGEG